MSAACIRIDHRAAPEDKIVLFQSLFRGREDVYAKRFESRRTGKSGYQPACANEWIRGVCAKATARGAKCTQCVYRPVTAETIWHHLSGCDETGRPFVMGLYPMLQDETCFLLALDFDNKQWRDDALAVSETCKRLNVPATLERSRSGNGCHLWLFFEEALSASLARQLGAHILTETMERRPDIGLDSYDRLFPSQDTLPRGGFGNLIALPLQKAAREQGNTTFLDDALQPHADPWAHLAASIKMSREQVEHLVHTAQKRDRITGIRMASDEEEADTPWTTPPSRRRNARTMTGPLPKEVTLTLGNEVYIPKEDLSPALRNALLRLAAFQNPAFYRAQAMRLPTYGTPRIIACAEEYPHHIGLPRGCLKDIEDLLSQLKVTPRIHDERCTGIPLDLSFHGTLRREQKAATDALLAHDTGVLAATTAFGKTVIGAAMMAQRGVNTLVLVHRRQLLDQWVERLSTFLGIPTKEIGRIGGGQKKVTGRIDVALVQSLVRKGVVSDLVGHYGHLLVDECHHLPAFSFEQVARRAGARFVLGLTATVVRKDGHHPIILMQCGPIRHRVNAKEQAAQRAFSHSVQVRPTGFQPRDQEDDDPRIQFHVLMDELTEDVERNEQICTDILRATAEGRSPLVLTERTRHLDLLAEHLAPTTPNLVILKGGMGRKATRQVAEQLATIPGQESRILLATGGYIGEGFDDPRLDTLFLTLPVSWRGTIAQYAGRLHREHTGKREVHIYDYADINVPMLARMFDRRCAGYEAIGYTVYLPAHAVPGWPESIPLPVDPAWKKNYAATIQRLVRDGVDEPLADLFVRATQPAAPDAQGAERARSATEAFLFRRLESLPQTAGRFRLNVELPIPFNQRSVMEVDFLCADARLVIEIDGAQHMNDPAAYRRDRRKDALLQENNYFVLRFLATDVGQNLDSLLETILRTLAHQKRLNAGNSACR